MGYVELIYAAQNNIPYGSVKNASGVICQSGSRGCQRRGSRRGKDYAR